jgi:hypothetical protein
MGYGIRVSLIKYSCFVINFISVSNKCVFIVIKTKYVNSSNISDICHKLNYIINYLHFTINDTFYYNFLHQ